jgi:Icc protein
MRILQITDCHLLPQAGTQIYGTDTYRSLHLVLEAAFGLDQPPELILATGDLSEDGSVDSYERLRELLLEPGAPVYVIAGNHDSPDGMRRALVGGTISMEPHLDLPAWRIIFLNSKVEGEPFGYLKNSELQRLRESLAEASERRAIVCLHHSAIQPCPSTGCHLKNEAEFLEALACNPNVRAVVAGHSHLELERRNGTAMLLTTPATSSQCVHAQLGEPVDHENFWASHEFDSSRHGFRILDLHADGNFETQVHWVRGEAAV